MVSLHLSCMMVVYVMICQCEGQTRGQGIDEIILAAMNSAQDEMSRNANLYRNLRAQLDNSVLLELDMRFTLEDYARLQMNRERAASRGFSMRGRLKRAATKLFSKWPGAVVPYTISSTFDTTGRQAVQAAIDSFTKYTCVRWQPRTSERNYVNIESGNGCWSYIGRVPSLSPQTLSLGRFCKTKGVASHEMMHSLGTFHEQARPDRDNYVTINWSNIQQSFIKNYEIGTTDEQETYNIPYDYASVMHYGAYVAAIDSRIPTMTATDSTQQDKMGNRAGLNFYDIQLINKMYGCADSCQSLACPNGGFQGKDCKCWCPTGDLNNPAVVCSPTVTCDAVGESCSCSSNSNACSLLPNTVCNTQTNACACKSGYELNSSGQCIEKVVVVVPTNQCVNLASSCDTYKSRGYCTQKEYSVWMSVNCPVSCHCDSGASENCEGTDSNSNCANWAERGYCETSTTNNYYGYMYRNCQKSCNYCCTCG